jgi:hypothetical protein
MSTLRLHEVPLGARIGQRPLPDIVNVIKTAEALFDLVASEAKNSECHELHIASDDLKPSASHRVDQLLPWMLFRHVHSYNVSALYSSRTRTRGAHTDCEDQVQKACDTLGWRCTETQARRVPQHCAAAGLPAQPPGTAVSSAALCRGQWHHCKLPKWCLVPLAAICTDSAAIVPQSSD